MLALKAQPGQQFDGISFVPALKGRPLDREAIFCHFPHGAGVRPGFEPSTYVRKGDWKLIRFYCGNNDQSDRFELYNLREDLGETKNLAAQHPDMVKELNAMISRFLEDTKAIVPKPNPSYDPAATKTQPAKRPKAARKAR